MTREDLIKLIEGIYDSAKKTDEEVFELLEKFKKNVPHPAPSNLIYWDDLTVEEVVDKALSYKPIQL